MSSDGVIHGNGRTRIRPKVRNIPLELGARFVADTGMGWLFWLMVAAIVAGIAALTGFKPRGTRPVAHTQLMGVARVVLLIAAVIVAYAAYTNWQH